MDVQEQIVSGIAKISDRQIENHNEVVQRLTALETKFENLAEIPSRVAKLEGWRSKVVGFTIAGNMLFAGVVAWLKKA